MGLFFLKMSWSFEVCWLFEETFEGLVNPLDSFDLFIFPLDLDVFLLVLELGLSEGVFFFEIFFFCQEQLFNSLVFEFVEIIFILLEFPVEFHFLKFRLFDLVCKFLNVGGLDWELLFDIFLISDFFAVVFEFGLEIVDFGDELGFFVIAQSLVLLFEEDFLLFL